MRISSRILTLPLFLLLAPAAASLDMFRGYGERGDAFAAAVHVLRDDAAGAPGDDDS
jgi:UDP-N-acetylmuramoylalanine--D-glutamate ligase